MRRERIRLPNKMKSTSPYQPGNHRERRGAPPDAYASSAQSDALLRSSSFRRDRMEAADMITTGAAAKLAGTSVVTVNGWIKAGRCIGVTEARGGFKLPRWQFEPFIWPLLQPLGECLGTTDGWQLLSFLETPLIALDGQTPRTALEQGASVDRILTLAKAEAH